MLWAGDTRKRVLANVAAYGGDVALATVTAPGQAVLPWDGTDARMVERVAARRWNHGAREQWRCLHRKAAQRASRFSKRHGGAWGILAKSWEFQLRGVLHAHVVLPCGTPLERMASQIYVEALAEMAAAHGFGYVDRGRKSKQGGVWRRRLEVIPAERAGRYVAKYVAKLGVGGEGLQLGPTVSHPDVPPQVVYVSRRLTASTGITMRSLRLRRYAHVLVRQLCEQDNGPEILDALEEGGMRSDEEIVACLGRAAAP